LSLTVEDFQNIDFQNEHYIVVNVNL